MKKLLNAVLGLTLGAAVSASAQTPTPATASSSTLDTVLDTRLNIIIHSPDTSRIDTLTNPGILFILK